jgi:hypothetical protein
MKTLMRGLVVILLSAAPAAAVSDTLGLSESLTIQVIHGGPACSSGSVLVAGVCQPEGTFSAEPSTLDPPLALAAPDPVFASITLPVGEDPPPTPTPEPATLLLVGSGLALAAGVRRVRRWACR